MQIFVLDDSNRLSISEKCDQNTCKDLVAETYKNFTHDFDITKPADVEGMEVSIVQFICELVAIDFSGYITFAANYRCTNSTGPDQFISRVRIEQPHYINICCKSGNFTSVDCSADIVNGEKVT